MTEKVGDVDKGQAVMEKTSRASVA